MPELIDRYATMDAIPAPTDADEAEYFDKICDAIEAMPTIEQEVRHGRWKGWTTSKFTGKYEDYDEPVFKDYVYYTCSECYRKSAIQELYCPNCGARMSAAKEG